MRMISLLRFSLCLFGSCVSAVSAQDESKESFRNVVIGEGCATTCVNGQCESTCNGKEAKAESIAMVEKEFAFSDFDKVVIKDVDTDIQYGKDYAVTLFHVPELVDKINIRVDQKTLMISLPKLYKSRYKSKLKITMPIIKQLVLEGNNDSVLENFQDNDLQIKVLGNANLKAQNNRIKKLVLQADQNADADLLSSEVLSAEVNIIDNATVKLNFQASPLSTLSGTVDGMADLLYCGTPQKSLVVADLSDVSSYDCD